MFEARTVSAKDTVGSADRILQQRVVVPLIGIAIGREKAPELFAVAAMAIWAYLASILVTLRQLLLAGPTSAEDVRQLRSWIGFQPWPLGPTVALLWFVGLPVAAAIIASEDDFPLGFFVLLTGCSILLTVVLFRARATLATARMTKSTPAR